MSGGAIALSTVHALEPHAYDALIFIAGGSNFLMINQESNYSPWVEAMTFEYGEPRLDARDQKALFEAMSSRYLDHAPLDGHRLAERARGKPILMLHGASDRAVPARFGTELWERLDKPERWVYPVGHELLFVTLNAQTPRVLRWLNEQDLERGSE
jgi:pimeloyl-ACP methyl ester carboxylesterase